MVRCSGLQLAILARTMGYCKRFIYNEKFAKKIVSLINSQHFYSWVSVAIVVALTNMGRSKF